MQYNRKTKYENSRYCNGVVMKKSNLIIVSAPQKQKHYIIRSTNEDELVLIGEVCIQGHIVSIANTYDEAVTIYNNLNR